MKLGHVEQYIKDAIKKKNKPEAGGKNHRIVLNVEFSECVKPSEASYLIYAWLSTHIGTGRKVFLAEEDKAPRFRGKYSGLRVKLYDTKSYAMTVAHLKRQG